MPNLRYSAVTDLPPEKVIRVATDFSENRPHLWPTIDPGVYTVHASGKRWADVTEGSKTLGGIWAHELYLWNDHSVTARVKESNIFRSGTWRLSARPRPGGGSIVEVSYHRIPRGIRGNIIAAVLRLSRGKPLLNGLKETLAIAERDEARKEVELRKAS